MIKKISRKINLSAPVKASIAFFFASVVSSGISYLTTPIYTRLLTTAEFGQASNYYTWQHIIGIVAMFCLSYGVFNNGMVDYPNKRDEYSLSMLALSNVITIIFYVTFRLLYPIISPVVRLGNGMLDIMFLNFFFQPAYLFWYARQRYEYKYKYSVVWSVVITLLSQAVSIIWTSSVCENRYISRVTGAELTMIGIYIGFYVYIFVKSKFKIQTKYWKQAFKFNLPLLPHYLSTYLLNSSDKLMITWLINESATAFYSVAYSVASVVSIVWMAINASLVPFTYEKCKEKNYEAIGKATSPILTVFAIVCVMLSLLAPEIVAIMAPESYLDAIIAIPPIIGGVFFQVQYYLYANIVYYYKQPKYIMYASLVATAANIILNYVFINAFGYAAAGYTTLICFMLQAAMDYWAMKKVINEKIYNVKYIMGLSVFVFVFAAVCSFLYDYSVIRFALVSGIIIVFILKWKQIARIFKLK